MLEPLFETIAARRREALLRESAPYARSVPIASDIGPCPRETALAILYWQQKPPFDEHLLARLEAGREAEPRDLSKLLAYQLEIVEQQCSFETRDRQGRVILRGRIDGKIKWGGRRVPFDIKTVTPLVFPRLNTVDDLLASPFFQKWAKQLWSYEYLNNIDTGFLLLDDLLGHWKCLEVPLDFDRMEQVLRQCESAVESVEQITRQHVPEDQALPPYHPDADVCRRCWAFGRVCTPPVTYEGMEILDDVDFEAKLDRRAALAESAQEYEALDKEVKARLKYRPRVIVGHYLVEGTEHIRHVNAKEAYAQKVWITKISRLAQPPVVSDVV